MVDFSSRQINKPFSAWVPKSKIMPKNVLCFFAEIAIWVDDGSSADVIYLDFQKAFYKLPNQILILKLKSHGMGNSIIK